MSAVNAGDQLGQYVVRREIGAGAMATVYEAEHVVLGKRVALKRMHPQLAVDATAAERFLREGKAATQIRSPHVVEVFDVGSHGGVPYLIMELLEGRDLAVHLRETRRLPLRELADWMVPIAFAVHAAHEAGVIHRDLKPSNLFLARRGGVVTPMVVDFGISRIGTELERDLTRSNVLLGTVAYMSPEQTRGGKNGTPLSDQYALGVVLYECVTGFKPFQGSTPYALMHAIVSSTPRAPSAIVPGLPPAFDRVVSRAMHKDPRQRFSSVRALGIALLPWASETTRVAYARDLGVEESRLALKRRAVSARWLAAAGVGVVAAAAFGFVVHSVRHSRALAISAEATSVATTPIEAASVPGTTPNPTSAPVPPMDSAGGPSVTSQAPPTVASDMRDVPGSGSVTVAAALPRAPRARAANLDDLVIDRSTVLAGKLQDASPPLKLTASPSRPERGTNGAFIVE
jgi:serine/threonine-protein kinase